MNKKIKIQYYAVLREQAGISGESIETNAQTPSELYDYLQQQYDFQLDKNVLKLAINGRFAKWKTALNDGDEVVFIPPVAGG